MKLTSIALAFSVLLAFAACEKKQEVAGPAAAPQSSTSPAALASVARDPRLELENGKKKAIATLESAKKYFENDKLDMARSILEDYLASDIQNQFPSESAEARKLLEEAFTASSFDLTLYSLRQLDDKEFEEVKASGELRDGKVTYPALVDVRKKTLNRIIEREIERRQQVESKKVAEQKRLAQESRDRERRRQQQEADELATSRRQQEISEARENPRPCAFATVKDTYEIFTGQYFLLEGVNVYGDWERDRERKVYHFTVDYRGDEIVRKGFSNNKITFVIPDVFGSTLNPVFDDNKKYLCNLKLEIAEIDGMPVAKVYCIQMLSYNPDSNSYEVYQSLDTPFPDK